jgi:hypothetical protein
MVCKPEKRVWIFLSRLPSDMTDIEKTDTPANPEQTTASIPPARQRRSWIFHFLCTGVAVTVLRTAADLGC